MKKLSLILLTLLFVISSSVPAIDIVTRAGKGSALSSTDYDTNLGLDAQAKTVDYAVLVTDNRDTIEFNGSNKTATLPDVATVIGAADTGDFQVTLINMNSTALTVAKTGSDTINGGTSYSLGQYESATFKANQAGNGWNVIKANKRIFYDDVGIGAAPTTAFHIQDASPIIRLEDTDSGGEYSQISGAGTSGSISMQADPTNAAASSKVSFDVDGAQVLALDTAATFGINIVSDTDSTDDIGTSGVRWANIYVDSINANNGGSLTGTWSDLGTVTTVDIDGGTIDGVTIGGASAGAGTFTTGAFSGAVSSTKSCAANYTRINPHFCKKDDQVTTTSLTRDACTTVTNPSANAYAIRIKTIQRVGGASSAGTQRNTQVQAFDDSGCTSEIDAFSFTMTEQAATSSSIMGQVHPSIYAVPASTGGNVYLKMTDDTGNNGSAWYVIRGYED